MTPSELCEILANKKSSEVAQALGLSERDTDSFYELSTALSQGWLFDNISDIIRALDKDPMIEGEYINALEANAFLASFQKAYENSNRPRSKKWANILTHKKELISEKGALKTLLPNIGIKPNMEFVDMRDAFAGDDQLL